VPEAVAEVLAADHLFDLSIEFSDMHAFAVPFGTRLTAVTSAGAARGARLAGDVLPGGGDWIVVGGDGIARLDVRITIRAESGELVHMTSQGRAILTDDARARFLTGETVAPPDLFARSTTQFETAGPTYGWMNASVAIGVVKQLSQHHIEYGYYGLG
jgi:hypothetical protein